MEWCSESNPRKKFKKDDIQTSNCEYYDNFVGFLAEHLGDETKGKANKTKYAEIFEQLKQLVPCLIDCNKDVNDRLQDFLKAHLKNANTPSLDQLSKMRIFAEKMLASGETPNMVGSLARHSALYLASICESKKILEMLIPCLQDFNERDENGNTILHLAIDRSVNEHTTMHKAGYVDVVRNLICNGANVNATNTRGESAVHLAAGKYHIDMLKIFADNGADFTRRTTAGETALHIVSRALSTVKDTFKILESIDFLIDRGCNVEAADNKGYTPLHYAAESGNLKIVDRLIQLGANVNCKSKCVKLVPLHLAARSDQLDVMKKLVEAGTDVNVEAADGATPIFQSVLEGSFESMQYLISQGADLHRRDNLRGFSLLHMAAYDNKSKIGSPSAADQYANMLKDDKKKLKSLLAAGLDVNDAASCGVSPLQLASLASKVESVRTLIKHGANVDFRGDETQFTALHFASMSRNAEIVQLLIEAGADVNCQGGLHKSTAMHLGLAQIIHWRLGRYRDEDTANRLQCASIDLRPKNLAAKNTSCHALMTILIKNGANVNAENMIGTTALNCACCHADSGLSKILLEARAIPDIQDHQAESPLFKTIRYNRDVAFGHLLDYGADINDVNDSQAIMKNNSSIKDKAIRHAIKLNVLGLPIAKVYEASIRDAAFDNFREECVAELNLLISHPIGNMSIYQFLRMKVKDQYRLVGKVSKLSLKNLKLLFPLYSGIIYGAFREAVLSQSFYEAATVALPKLCNFYFPDLCSDLIISYLSSRYLRAIIDSSEPNERIPVDDKMFVIVGDIKRSN